MVRKINKNILFGNLIMDIAEVTTLIITLIAFKERSILIGIGGIIIFLTMIIFRSIEEVEF